MDGIRRLVEVPILTVVNKADIRAIEGYPTMSTLTGEGVDEVLDLLLTYQKESKKASPRGPLQSENQQ